MRSPAVSQASPVRSTAHPAVWRRWANSLRFAGVLSSRTLGLLDRRSDFVIRTERRRNAELSGELLIEEIPSDAHAGRLAERDRLGTAQARIVESEAAGRDQQSAVGVELYEPHLNVSHPADGIERDVSSVADEDQAADTVQCTRQPRLTAMWPAPVPDDEATTVDLKLDPVAVHDTDAGSADGNG